MTLQKAFELLQVRYTWASAQKHIRNPLAWALYQVWREVDGGEANDRS